MLKQLSQLTLDADGRYATAQELQFLKDYLNSIDERISVYQKIKEHCGEMVEQIETIKKGKEEFFNTCDHDISDICRRDLTNNLRYSAGVVLIGDLDRMREGLLIWYQTIVRAYKFEKGMGFTYKIIQDVVKQHLTPEEAELIVPVFQLEHTILSI